MTKDMTYTLVLFPALERVVQMSVFRRESELTGNYVRKDFKRGAPVL